MNEQKTAVERRRYKRFDLSLEVKYRLPGWNQSFTCHTKNISGGGVCLVVDTELKEATPLEIEFPPLSQEQKEPFVVRGEAVWRREVGGSDSIHPSGGEDAALPPWQAPFAASFTFGTQRLSRHYEVGIQFVGMKSETVLQLIKYIGSGSISDWSTNKEEGR